MPKIERKKAEYIYTKKDGTKVKVPAHKQHYHMSADFDEIEEEVAKSLFIERMHKTHPDILNNANRMFWKANTYWKEHMGDTDLYGVDGNQAPKSRSKPDFGLPYEMLEYHGDIYYADETGFFMRKKDYIELQEMTQKELAAELNEHNSKWNKSEYIRKTYEQRDLFTHDPAQQEFHEARKMTKDEIIKELHKETRLTPHVSQLKKMKKSELVNLYGNRHSFMTEAQKRKKIDELKRQKSTLQTSYVFKRGLNDYERRKLEHELRTVENELAYFRERTKSFTSVTTESASINLT